jgi:hypothetical protein
LIGGTSRSGVPRPQAVFALKILKELKNARVVKAVDIVPEAAPVLAL